MVDVSLLQQLSYVAAAIGVCAASAYYMMILRATQQNMRLTLETRRIGVVENMMRMFTDTEGRKKAIELLNFEWTDYEDFERKYGSDNNVDAAAKRYSLWNNWNSLGMMLRKEMVEAEDLYDLGGSTMPLFWKKWKPIVEEVRRRYWGQDYLKDCDYLYEEMMKVKLRRDPRYVIPETLGKYVPDK